MAKKAENDYFRMFADMAQTACLAVEKLKAVLEGFDTGTLEDEMAELHRIESGGDTQKHTLLERLAKEFITPIEREDILDLAGEIDDVTDSVEDILINIYMFNIRSILPDALEFAAIVEQCCLELRTILREFSDFKRSKTIHASIIELNRLEETGDKLYVQAVRSLHTSGGDPVAINAWTTVYGCFERCCDTCEHAANVVESVIMKNT